jgi:hypothetical protein
MFLQLFVQLFVLALCCITFGCTQLSLLTRRFFAAAAAAAAEEADVLDRLVKLAHSISNRQLADAAPANRHALESELKPLVDQVRSMHEQVRCMNHSLF